jgi:hypothetical protein
MRKCCCDENVGECDCACFLDEKNRNKFVEKEPSCNLGEEDCISCGS